MTSDYSRELAPTEKPHAYNSKISPVRYHCFVQVSTNATLAILPYLHYHSDFPYWNLSACRLRTHRSIGVRCYNGYLSRNHLQVNVKHPQTHQASSRRRKPDVTRSRLVRTSYTRGFRSIAKKSLRTCAHPWCPLNFPIVRTHPRRNRLE